MEKLNDNITLIKGDAFKVIKDIADNSIDLVVTDPPYFMNPVSAVSKNNQINKEEDQQNTSIFYERLFSDIYRVLNNKGKAFVCMNRVSYIAAQTALNNLNIKLGNLIVWDKNHLGLSGSRKTYRPSYEFIMYFYKPDAQVDDRTARDVIQICGNPAKRKTKHPAEKPLALIEHLIDMSEIKKGTVLDLFVGSGTTSIAGHNKGLKTIGIEWNEKRYQEAKDRILSAIN